MYFILDGSELGRRVRCARGRRRRAAVCRYARGVGLRLFVVACLWPNSVVLRLFCRAQCLHSVTMMTTDPDTRNLQYARARSTSQCMPKPNPVTGGCGVRPERTGLNDSCIFRLAVSDERRSQASCTHNSLGPLSIPSDRVNQCRQFPVHC